MKAVRSQSEIALRAEVQDKTLSEFQTQKEAMLFSEDGVGYSIQVSAGASPAVQARLKAVEAPPSRAGSSPVWRPL